MSLFQKSVINNQLESIDDNDIKEGWDNFQSYKSIINNIKGYKEEEFQFDFLKMIFNDCLGYKISDVGDEQRNLYTEVKNVSDSKKADGAIKKNDKVIAVIELKSPKTRDFKKIQDQAFLYKASHGVKCNYVITSNFEKLRFYIDSSSDFEEFNLFNLTKDDFKLLYICLHKENLFSGIPKKLKDESVLVEENVTKKLYKDYSAFRRELFDSLVKSNIEYDKLLLFNKTQKLLDRFLFIFFAEDRNLVPPNSISKIVNKWEGDVGFGESRSLYSIFKQYFNVLNNGRPARGKHEAIFAYNGGLFADDEILDSIEIDDNILLKHTKNLSHYDFESEISVNILGHIFENSLSEIEEIQNEISGEGKSVSKRKKDGVFYTPSYITKYIVENTVGKLCEEKRAELGFNEAEFVKDRKGRQQNTLKKLSNQLDSYREWLLGITICDPACGSGAFLVEALNFLIYEHKYIDELKTSLFGASIQYSDINASILENNLYGVDINEESVEIAKLSLWLRTAEKGRKLTSLSNNIKCGNSLIDNFEVDEKAFNWEKEFPEVIAKGGFDVVIGNPPYVQLSKVKGFSENAKNYLRERFNTSAGRLNTYIFFIHLINDIAKTNALASYIIPNTILTQEYYVKTRKLFLDKLSIYEITTYPYMPFPDAVVENITLFLMNGNLINEFRITEQTQYDLRVKKSLEKSIIRNAYKNNIEIQGDLVCDSIESKKFKQLGELVDINQAIALKGDKSLSVKSSYNKGCYKLIDGKHIGKYEINWGGDYLEYDLNRIHSCKRKDIFESEAKLFFRRVSSKLIFAYDEEQYFALNTLIVVNLKDNPNISLKALIAILNSKVLNHYYLKKYKSTKTVFSEIQARTVKLLPIPSVSVKFQNTLYKCTDDIIQLKKDLKKNSIKFIDLLESDFSLDNTGKNIKKWYLLEWSQFEKELTKRNIIISGIKKEEWYERFMRLKNEVKNIILQIDLVNNEIDKLVYELYGLTKEEIEIVENS